MLILLSLPKVSRTIKERTSGVKCCKSFEVLKKIKGNPNAEVTIYRATTGDSINDGDWITLSQEYADIHNKHSLQSKGKILKMKVKASEIRFAGDDIREFGYFAE